ncbi:MAG: diacylglycerol kinase family lipid kinase [Alicyclobacillus sp.]|nr:diacylglycerol kinase family lipid kinase [Alicyclobacillus sp.]
MHYHFVVSEQAGRGRARKVWQQLADYLNHLADHGRSVRYSVSAAGEPIPALPQGESVLVAVGGDGSVHHAAQFAVREQLPLGIIPAGTGNDFARTLGIPVQPQAALDHLLSGRPEAVDVAAAGERLFVNAAGFGVDAYVVHFIERHRWLKRRGSLGYALSLPVALLRYRPVTFAVELDGQEEQFHDVTLLVIANGPRFAGGMQLVPDAHVMDGELDLIVAHELSKTGLLRLFPRVYQGTHILHPAVTLRRARRIRIIGPGQHFLGQFDGERGQGYEGLEIRCLANQLKIVRWSNS